MGKDARHIAIAVVIAMLLVLLGGVAGGIIGYNRCKNECNLSIIDTVVVHRTDTVTLAEARHDTLIRIVDKLRPVAVHDTVTVGDTMYVVLPYESRHYSVPDTLDVWYSGVDPCIDSARVYVHNVTEVIREPYEVKQPVRSNFLGVEAGVHDASLMYVRRMGAVSVGFSAGAIYQDRSPTARLVVGINF